MLLDIGNLNNIPYTICQNTEYFYAFSLNCTSSGPIPDVLKQWYVLWSYLSVLLWFHLQHMKMKKNRKISEKLTQMAIEDTRNLTGGFFQDQVLQEHGHHWFRSRLRHCTAPSHYMGHIHCIIQIAVYSYRPHSSIVDFSVRSRYLRQG